MPNFNYKTAIVTGGCGFIGTNFVGYLIDLGWHVINIDSLTYAANVDEFNMTSPYVDFFEDDIRDKEAISRIFDNFNFDVIFNLAAETHVDNSIKNPRAFIDTNILGTHNLLQAAKEQFEEGKKFTFVHVSTDEVYGSLKLDELPFSETSQYKPNSPYAASKAASDHLVRSYNQTYGLPTIITHCSNNFGPWQHQEKFIPTIINSLRKGIDVPIYGDGTNRRSWLWVEDHCRGLMRAYQEGKIGETYLFGGEEKSNLEIVDIIIDSFRRNLELFGAVDRKYFKNLIKFVPDRLGHDFRYACDTSKAEKDLDWFSTPFDSHMDDTVLWYLTRASNIGNFVD